MNYGQKVEAQMYLAKRDGTTSDIVPFTFIPPTFTQPKEPTSPEQRIIQVAQRQNHKRDRNQMKQQIINNEVVQEESTGRIIHSKKCFTKYHNFKSLATQLLHVLLTNF